MTEEKEKLLERIQEKIRVRLNDKFRKGDTEHENDLLSIDLLSEAFDEVLDLSVYILALQEKSVDYYQKGYADGFKAALQPIDKEETD